MKYKYIEIFKAGQNFGEPFYKINNIRSNDCLGYLDYYPIWKKYVFTCAVIEAVFSDDCLEDIIDFMKNHAGKE